MKTMKVKVAELILDWNLWPRNKAESLDSTNVNRMKEALLAGIQLPPIIVNKKDLRVVDGFHRTRAYQSVYGDNFEIEVEPKEYANDADMFEASGRINSHHGLPMSPQDIVHFCIKARKYKMTIPKIAEILSMQVSSLKVLYEERTAMTESGERIALTQPLGSSLGGTTLSRDQERIARNDNGTPNNVIASLFLGRIKTHSIKITARAIELFIEIRDRLTKIIEGYQGGQK